jgi:hypothetical protein
MISPYFFVIVSIFNTQKLICLLSLNKRQTMIIWQEIVIYLFTIVQCILILFKIRYPELNWWIIMIPYECLSIGLLFYIAYIQHFKVTNQFVLIKQEY